LTAIDKANLSERDITTKFILPALVQAGWDPMTQLREEVKLRDGKVIVRGQIGMRKTVNSQPLPVFHL
jgi:type I restriction enzyme R subunit